MLIVALQVGLQPVGLKLTETFSGTDSAESETVCETSDTLVKLTVEVIGPPVVVINPEEGLSDSVKLKYLTISVNVVVLTTPLEVIAVIRQGYVPGGVVIEVFIVSVDEHDKIQLVGLNVAIQPLGNPETENVTFSGKPVIRLAETTVEVWLPWSIVRETGSTTMV